ncbi:MULTISPECIES: hypothetical protein [Citrobacter]|uniref:hypothetical protein n=1 Tax=Citrobacter TaxID=544 RepID=UPI001249633E|nr:MULTISPECIES: hypothetical protein [Citrobacter]MBA7874790.1 hypothetical protein [Citrobacter sp. RHBSTW-00827]MBA7935825.1 hypothetical protein [Citrobacter sp. RHBSTW-00509]MBJ7588128.1 hypothetical protein [Citrobacter freundii]MDK2368864.1 hypothetical protein [Citrobacter freundii]MDT7438852.1 hypothetical protein [Citrobacter freundii]
MKRILLLAIALNLTGCMNIYNYRGEQPITATFLSSHTPQETQECILSSWQKEPLGNSVTAQKTYGFYSVLAVSDNVDVYYEKNSVIVNYYSLRGSLDPWNGKVKRIKAIQSCL